jgi:hypothetical protein
VRKAGAPLARSSGRAKIPEDGRFAALSLRSLSRRCLTEPACGQLRPREDSGYGCVTVTVTVRGGGS